MVTKIIMEGCSADNNDKGGVWIEGTDVELHMKNTTLNGNGGAGLRVLPFAPTMGELGLPSDTDPKEILQLLCALRDSDQKQHQAIVAKSDLINKAAGLGKDITSIISSITTIASTPALQLLIAKLSGG